jgi:hypothetical protein
MMPALSIFALVLAVVLRVRQQERAKRRETQQRLAARNDRDWMGVG